MSAIDFLAIPNGMIGALLWLGIVRAIVRHRPDADAITFVAMSALLMVACILATVLPTVAIKGIKGPLTTLGYLIVLIWFWKSRHLAVVTREKANG